MNHRLKTMKCKRSSRGQALPRQSARFGMLLMLLLSLLLAGCNFPRPLDRTHAQRLTEIAGILNPPRTGQTPVLPTITPGPPPAMERPGAPINVENGFLLYTSQQGDTLPALALRFDVPPEAIQAAIALPPQGLLPPGTSLLIPDLVEAPLAPDGPFIPDSEVTYGPTVGDFNTIEFALSAGGFLSIYTEGGLTRVMTGPEIVQRVAVETSTNPRLLLALLEFRSGWVFSFPEGAATERYPIGFGAGEETGLYKELMITARILAQGFYGWRDGSRLETSPYGGSSGRLAPGLNAGSAALIQLFTTLYPESAWEDALLGESSFLNFYEGMFGDPWERSLAVEPYLLAGTSQPELSLPFALREDWSLTGGPHITWQTGTPWGAIDFAPITGEERCAVSFRWALAAAPGLVVRSERGVVALDLDGDGDEGTGWVLIYLHMATKGRASLGSWLEQDDRVGHPSCEGGRASGTHLHFARKFNGEWVNAGDPLPLVLSGWEAVAGAVQYGGFLQKGEEMIAASPTGSRGATIIRED